MGNKCPKCGHETLETYSEGWLFCENPFSTCPTFSAKASLVPAPGPSSENPAPAQPVSVKHDSEKPAVQYIPMEALFEMGKAYGFGARKYGGYNFQHTGLEVTRCLAAATRHIFQFIAGEDKDKESGESHLGHAMAAIGMAIYTLAHHPAKDDRFKPTKAPND